MATPVRSLLLAALTLGACTPPAADPPPREAAPLLVSSEWLAGNLDMDGLVVLHVGSDSSHTAGHIPGARPLALIGFAPEVEGMSTEMPEPAALRELLEAAGVSPTPGSWSTRPPTLPSLPPAST